jgi:hypothetical protein
VAGLTLGVADATATAVAKIRIKQFLAIPFAGKVVAGPCMMTMPDSFSYAKTSPIRTQGRCQESTALATDTAMKTFHEWLAMREGLWLNDKNAVIGMSRLNPLPKNSAVNKSLAKGPAKAKAMPGVAAATPKPFKPTPPASFKPLKLPKPTKAKMVHHPLAVENHVTFAKGKFRSIRKSYFLP